MCSISGIICLKDCSLTRTEKIDIINKLLINGQERGTDASGIAVINTDNDTIKVHKNKMNASTLVTSQPYTTFVLNNLDKGNIILCHNRAQTQGDKKDNKNNHPIYNKSNNSVMIHNGMVSNYEELVKRFRIDPDGDVDSEIILQLYQEFGNNFKKAIKRISGSFAIALYHEKKLHLFRDMNPFHLAYLPSKKAIVFGSTEDIINSSLESTKNYLGIFETEELKYDVVFKELDNEDLYIFSFNKGFEFDIDKKTATTKEYVWNQRTSGGTRGMYCNSHHSELEKDFEFDKEKGLYLRKNNSESLTEMMGNVKKIRTTKLIGKKETLEKMSLLFDTTDWQTLDNEEKEIFVEFMKDLKETRKKEVELKTEKKVQELIEEKADNEINSQIANKINDEVWEDYYGY